MVKGGQQTLRPRLADRRELREREGGLNSAKNVPPFPREKRGERQYQPDKLRTSTPPGAGRKDMASAAKMSGPMELGR